MIKCPITGINLKFRGGYFRHREISNKDKRQNAK